MRALVTGAAGFLGSSLCDALLEAGAEVIGLDAFVPSYPEPLKRRNLARAAKHPRFRLVEADLRHAELGAILEGVTHVAHLAALAGVRGSWGAAFGDYAGHNVLATQRLLESLRGRAIERVVVASSSSVYGTPERLPTPEEEPPRPLSPYGVTKVATEALLQAYRASCGVPAVGIRYFTVYGPRQRPDMGIHRFFEAAKQGTEITIYGDGEQTRDFTFVDDAIAATRAALTRTAESLVYNVGGGHRITVNELLRAVERASGAAVRRRHEPAAMGDPRDTSADTSRAERDLDYRPRTELREGLRRQWEWQRNPGLTGAAPAATPSVAAGAPGPDASSPGGMGGAGGVPGVVDLTVLIPVYNEGENLEPLLEKLESDLEPLGLRAEILVIDDGSSDDTVGRLRALKSRHRGLRAVSFRRNYGKSAALSVGFREARGRVIVTMDGDLQDDSAEIGPLIRKLDEGYDLVSGWKQNRQDPISKTVPSRIFNGVSSAMTGVRLHDMNCGLKAYRAETAKSVQLRGELHRFIPVLAHWNGYRIGELPVVHHKRRFGTTKFGASRFVNGFLDLLSVMFLTTSSTRPLHVFGRMGIGVALLGFLFTIWAAWPVVLGEPLRLRPSLVLGLVLIVLGIQFLSLGFLGELIAGTRTTEPEYAIRERM